MLCIILFLYIYKWANKLHINGRSVSHFHCNISHGVVIILHICTILHIAEKKNDAHKLSHSDSWNRNKCCTCCITEAEQAAGLLMRDTCVVWIHLDAYVCKQNIDTPLQLLLLNCILLKVLNK